MYTYAPFGERVFLASPVPRARIAARDVLAIFPADDDARRPAAGMLELPPKAFAEFVELSARTQRRHELLYCACASAIKPRRRWLVI